MNQEEKYRIIMRCLDMWMSAREEKCYIDVYLKKKNIKAIGIYGYGILGRHLLTELAKTDIEIKWVMDKRDVSNQFSCLYLEPASCEIPADIDIIINTAVTDEERIEKKFIDIGFDRVIFIGEILEEIRYQ